MLRMIRAEMALAARFRFAGLFGAELVPGVAGGAGAQASVGIDSADAGVGPAGKRAVVLRDDETSVAFDASEVDVVVVVRGIVEQSYFGQYSAIRKQRRQCGLGHVLGIEQFCCFLTEWIEPVGLCLEVVRFQRTHESGPCVFAPGVLFDLLGMAVHAILR